MAVETKQEEIRRKSLERLQNDLKAYAQELVSLEEERKGIVEREGGDAYALKMLNERVRETQDALRSTESIYEKIKGRM